MSKSLMRRPTNHTKSRHGATCGARGVGGVFVGAQASGLRQTGWDILPCMSDLTGLPVGQFESVPAQLRMLASVENLGTLRSVHQPASWFTRLQYRKGRIYLFDQGFVFGAAPGPFRLFRWGQITVRKSGGGYLIIGADRRAMALARKWSGFAELEQAITAGAGGQVAD